MQGTGDLVYLPCDSRQLWGLAQKAQLYQKPWCGLTLSLAIRWPSHVIFLRVFLCCGVIKRVPLSRQCETQIQEHVCWKVPGEPDCRGWFQLLLPEINADHRTQELSRVLKDLSFPF